MDEVIWVGVMPVFIHHDCVKLIGNGGAYKLSCALKPLSILNTGSITSFLPTSLSTCLKWKIKKKKRWDKWMKQYGNFFPTIVSFLMWSIKWRCKEINKKKTFFCEKVSFLQMPVSTTGVIYFTFVLWKLASYFLILKTFYMFLFGCFSFLVPTRFLEVNRPR